MKWHKYSEEKPKPNDVCLIKKHLYYEFNSNFNGSSGCDSAVGRLPSVCGQPVLQSGRRSAH